MKWILSLLFLTCILPQALSAGSFVEKNAKHEKTWKNFNDATEEKAEEAKYILFGPITKLLGAFGIAYGFIALLTTGSYSPLIKFGGIGLLINIVPFYIDTVFGALLP